MLNDTFFNHQLLMCNLLIEISDASKSILNIYELGFYATVITINSIGLTL